MVGRGEAPAGLKLAIARAWRTYGWLFMAIIALAVLALGFFGSWAQHPALTPWDWLYDSFRLFWAGGDLVAQNAALNWARFLAPLIAVAAIFKTFAGAVADSRDRFASNLLARSHVVVCGAGLTGAAVVRGVVQAKLSVVVLDKDPPADEIHELRAAGARLVVGDCRSVQDLRQVSANRARYLIAVTNDDEANLRAIEHVRSEARNRPKCIAHVGSISLWPSLCRRYRDDHDVRLVNHHDQSAAAMLSRLPAFDRHEPEPTQIAIIGTGRLCASLVAHVAKRWQIQRRDPDARIVVLITGEEATAYVQHLTEFFDGIDRLLDMRAFDLHASQMGTTGVRRIRENSRGLRAAYVALDDEQQAAVMSLSLLDDPLDVAIAVRLDDESVLLPSERSHLQVVSPLESFRDARLLLQDVSELMAETAHADYCRTEIERARLEGRGVKPAAKVSWQDLPEYAKGRPTPLDHVRAQNRSQVESIGDQLQDIGCEVTPILDWDAAPFMFEESEVDALAPQEHERWMETMKGLDFEDDPCSRAAGTWLTDYDERTTPFFVPFAELPPGNQEQDRQAVLRIPWLLALVGLRPCRR